MCCGETPHNKWHRRNTPAPAGDDGNMTLEYKFVETGTILFSIHDVTGKIVKEQVLNQQNNKATIQAEGLKSGIYYYTITINGNRKETNKLVIIK